MSAPTAYCPTCRHRDPRTGRCRDVPPYDYVYQAPIACTAYDGPDLDTEKPAEVKS